MIVSEQDKTVQCFSHPVPLKCKATRLADWLASHELLDMDVQQVRSSARCRARAQDPTSHYHRFGASEACT
jgi:hypothetical protein